jgi:hypothetical protein
MDRIHVSVAPSIVTGAHTTLQVRQKTYGITSGNAMPKTRTPKIATDDAAGWRREAKEKKKHLKDLTGAVTHFLNRLDVVMKEPSTVERGRRIAHLSNDLDMANDIARHFGLDVALKDLSKGKNKS